MRVGRRADDRRLLVPEVVQTSAMDCGPASLKCLLEGFGIGVSYGRLREACQTDVDGTSIDTIEDVANQLGLDAEQIMLPVDHLLLPEARALPALVVVRLSSGVTHFVVVWRRHGPLVQVMDPAAGRRWITCRRLLSDLYVHEHPIPAAVWRDWAGSEEFSGAVRHRLAHLDIGRDDAERRVARALDDPTWRSLAALDAATRTTEAIVRAGGLRRGAEAASGLERLLAIATEPTPAGASSIPADRCAVRPAMASMRDGDGAGTHDGDGAGPSSASEQLILRGAVLVRVIRRRPEGGGVAGAAPLSPELVGALAEPAVRPERELLGLLRADGARAPLAILAALLLAAGGVALEAVLLRGLVDVGRDLGLASQRLEAVGALLLFGLALLALELPVAMGLLGMGRRLEARLRIAFLGKIPRLGDRYLHSRLTSDMAERGHSLHRIRLLPELAGQFLRIAFQLVLTTAGIVWLDPASAPYAIPVALLAIGIPLAAQPVLGERDLRVRNHAGALSRFYLDALLGLVPVRVHGAERAVRREHERLLVEWARAGVVLQRAVVGVEAAQLLMGFGLVWVLVQHLTQRGEPASALLLIYWALSLPMLGENVAVLARQYPDLRNVTLRMLEPLGAPEESDRRSGAAPDSTVAASAPRPHEAGVAITMEAVCVRAAGHTVLEGIDLAVVPSSHVAIVGSSGAGKSSLVGLLLGWHPAASGRVLIDGTELDGDMIRRLRRVTTWIDPSVQLWNRSLLENLTYGTVGEPALPIGRLIEMADLRSLLMGLPDGLQTVLGEGGALVSGGEGQRVRLARAMLRRDIRLAILDEPFRGLDRERRHELLGRARELWKGATLLCITHDVSETASFERVIVVEGGRIVEDGKPGALAATAGSRYASLLAAERTVRERLWSGEEWRRLRLSGGRLIADGALGES